LPIEGVFAGAVLLQMRQPRDGLFHARPVAVLHPPQRNGRPFEMLEPVSTAAIEALVHGLPDETLEIGGFGSEADLKDRVYGLAKVHKQK
jgi:hypothetical protein